MNKERIVNAATMLFGQYGIRAVSMDLIARTMGISKKTIYEEFSNKEELITHCVIQGIANMQQEIDCVEKEAGNPIRTLVEMGKIVTDKRSSLCPSFAMDIQRFPVLEKKIEVFREQTKQVFLSHFLRGVKEGYFRPEPDYKLIADLFWEQMSVSRPEYLPILSQTFFRGICSEKGETELEKYSYQQQVNSMTNYLWV